jgi:hypothetical protein
LRLVHVTFPISLDASDLICCNTDDLPFLFSSESLDDASNTLDRANERSAFINALAVILGVPPESNYYHLAAFEPKMLDSNNGNRTQGLGSGMATYAKVRAVMQVVV